MNLLAFDTSTDTMSIAVSRGVGGLAQVWQHTGAGGALASSTLIPAIRQLMQQAGLQFDQLDAIAFGRGPGSFTGLRTACSVAQGLAFGAGVPVLPVDSLLAVAEEARYQEAMKEPTQEATQETTQEVVRQSPGDGAWSPASWPQAPTSPLRVLALLDARMDEMYAAKYEFNSGLWLQHDGCSLIRPENLVESLPGGAGGVEGPRGLIAGNVFAVFADRLPACRAPRIHALPTATAMLRLAPALLAAGQAVPADQALPTYIRDKVAKTTQERLVEKAA